MVLWHLEALRELVVLKVKRDRKVLKEKSGSLVCKANKENRETLGKVREKCC